jgi:hypothetical protein
MRCFVEIVVHLVITSQHRFCHPRRTDTKVVAIAGYFINYAVDTRPGTSSATGSKMLAGAQGAFAAGRFSGTILMRYIRPRKVFLFYLTAVVIFIAAATGARHNSGIGMSLHRKCHGEHDPVTMSEPSC